MAQAPNTDETHPATTGPGHFDGTAFVLPIRVYYADTDAGGIVYHSVYLDMAERARTELLRALGHPLVSAEGGHFVVRRAEIDWMRPARLDDLLSCVTGVLDLGAARAVLRQTFFRDGERLADATVTLAHVGPDLRPVRMTAPLRAAFARCRIG